MLNKHTADLQAVDKTANGTELLIKGKAEFDFETRAKSYQWCFVV